MHTETTLSSTPALSKATHSYSITYSAPLPDSVAAVHARTLEFCEQRGIDPVYMISPSEAQFLAFLARMMGAKRVLEIGTFTGYSALAMAHAVPDAEVVTLDLQDAVGAELARENLRGCGNVRLVEGDAMETLKTLPPSPPFDLIFLDANKNGYIPYTSYILSQRLLSPHGILVVDNTLSKGFVLENSPPEEGFRGVEIPGREELGKKWEVMGKEVQRFNEWVRGREDVEVVVVPVWDGVSLVRWKGVGSM
ncbi:S-adenosyl-L-methionine-dependent methyltransferase [Ascodesmis nigricans]|uniref:S-adenosyl-L-methionine-dependent methyltransferase n=1 Tax=Ascodesmis nigricans TaxID=341454 RepID=A0A4S2N0R1_9PEZI|nr:S-adenosyl-L-methionine-dependent methyltransferase [Ascodesmis nigricans]